ncbi:MAG TPA: sulfite exporter TauE/SafE family protein [Promineifilum sp.]|nr:sulfite exporter TauE/SafE family protein [Promineifilum sp.]
MILGSLDYLLIALAAVAAGAVNALAGGGTLITFPALTAVGLPTVAANITNTVAISPGYLGATLAQRTEILDQRRRLWILLPAAALGGLVGGLLLLNTSEKLFRQLVPYLILLASILLAVQEPLRRWLVSHAQEGGTHKSGDERWAAVPIFFASVYGGYFGAGLSVIVLAVLGLSLDDSLTRLNAIKQAVSFVTNTMAALLFVFTGHVVWPAAAVMAGGAMIGGALGGKLAGHVRPVTLRWIVVTIGVIISVIYFIRG